MENRILGHESVGEVVEVGSAVKNFKPGDRVIVNCVTPDWEAPMLQDGFDKIEEAFHVMDTKPRDLIKPYVLI